MKKTAISTVLALALGSSAVLAHDSLEEAFKDATFKGHVGLYGKLIKYKGEAEDKGFSAAHASVGYETAPIHGVSLGLAAWGNARLSNKNEAYKEFVGDNAIFHEAFLKVAHEEMGALIVGRQEVDLEWLGDYIEGVVGVVTPMEELAVVAGWAKRQGVVDLVGADEAKNFERMNEKKGVYVLDVKYSPLEWLELNPYYYHVADVLKAPGIKATASLGLAEDFVGSTMLQYVDVSASGEAEDGYVAQVEQGFEFFGANAALGYIKTDKKSGSAGIESFGDQNPLAAGDQVYGTDAKTFYLSAGYEFEGASIEAIYSQTKYLGEEGEGAAAEMKKMKEKEFSITLGYSFMENLEAEFQYVNVKNDNDDESYNGFKVAATYSF